MIRSLSFRLSMSACLVLGISASGAFAQQQGSGAASSSSRAQSPARDAVAPQGQGKTRSQGQGAPGKVQGTGKSAAQSAPPPATSPAPGGGQASLLESYGDWGVYTTTGRSKVCYALAQPKSRAPSTLKDVKGYLFVSARPADKVKNEISLIMNFDLKEEAEHQAVIGQNQFNLVAKGKNLWVKNPAEESRVVEAMKRAGEMTVKGTSSKNNATADKYSLKGFGEAVDRVSKECR